jgi:hypothetical protein
MREAKALVGHSELVSESASKKYLEKRKILN